MKKNKLSELYGKIKTPEELLLFMQNNIKYGYLAKSGKVYHFDDILLNRDWYDNYVLESKEDILNTEFGNCFDQVELERSWFLEQDFEVKTIFIMVLLDYKNEYPTHSYLVYRDKEDGKWCYFENADFYNRGIHKFDNINDAIKYQYECYMKLLDSKGITFKEKDHIIANYYLKPKEHLTASEYLNYVINSKNKIIRR